MTSAVDEILKSSRASTFARDLTRRMDAERAKRSAFYEWLTPNVKAEFINGEVFVHSPVNYTHNRVTGRLFKLLDTLVVQQGAGTVGFKKLLIALERNDYEPDVCYFDLAKARTFTRDQMKFPAPDWVVEVLSPTTEHHDRGVKFQDYADHGVREYWIIDADAETVEQYELKDGAFHLLLKVNQGTIVGRVLPGFVVPVRALFDDTENVAALRAILGGG